MVPGIVCITNNSIKHQSFVYIQLNHQTVLFLTIQFSINHLFALSLNVNSILPIDRTHQVLPLLAREDLGAIVMKGYSAFPRAPVLKEPDHQIVLCHIQDTKWGGGLTPLQRCTMYNRASADRTIFSWVVAVAFNKFPDFFTQVFKIVEDSWKFSMLLLYILWDDWPIFMISGLNEQLQQELEYTLLNPDCHSWWISKLLSGRENTLEERYTIKMPQNHVECFRLLLEHLAWIEHQFLSGIRKDSRKAERVCEGLWEVWGGVRKSIDQSWLAKGLGLGLLCWGFKGVQEEIPSEEASTLQIGSVAFPPGQCTSPQLHRCHRLFDQDGH